MVCCIRNDLQYTNFAWLSDQTWKALKHIWAAHLKKSTYQCCAMVSCTELCSWRLFLSFLFGHHAVQLHRGIIAIWLEAVMLWTRPSAPLTDRQSQVGFLHCLHMFALIMCYMHLDMRCIHRHCWFIGEILTPVLEFQDDTILMHHADKALIANGSCSMPIIINCMDI
jgi:hypothetical protein